MIPRMGSKSSGARKRPPATKRTKPLPVPRAILLCERVIQDALSGTISLICVLTRFNLTQFPGDLPGFSIFVQLVGGIVGHEYAFTVEIIDQAMVIARMPPMVLRFSYRGQVQDIIIRVPPVRLAHAGVYEVVVLVDGNEVAHQTFDTPQEAQHDAGSR